MNIVATSPKINSHVCELKCTIQNLIMFPKPKDKRTSIYDLSKDYSSQVCVQHLKVCETDKGIYETKILGKEKHPFSFICNKYNRIGVAGTFDHIHSGHRALLSASTLLTKKNEGKVGKLVVGVTKGNLLANKEYKSALQPLGERRRKVKEFIDMLNSKNVEVGRQACEYSILDIETPTGPVVEEDDYDAIVVSKETEQGAFYINSKRKKPLDIIVVPLVTVWGRKVSSTARRSKVL